MTSAQWRAGRPRLSPANEVVIDVWRFCDGWNPDRIPMAAAYYGVDDLEFLVKQLLALDDTIRAHKDAQQKAR